MGVDKIMAMPTNGKPRLGIQKILAQSTEHVMHIDCVMLAASQAYRAVRILN